MNKRKIQRTFAEDTEMSIVMNEIDSIMYAHSYEVDSKDPAEMEMRLSNKVKITFEITGEIKPF